MARYWIRQWPMFLADNGLMVYKFLSIWLIQCLGYTKQDASSTNWTSVEDSGNSGSFAGSTDTFVDSSATFSSSDVGKHILLLDQSEPRNTGWYLIRKYISSTSVAIDFYAQSYPYSSSNIAWWKLGSAYQPPAVSAWIKLRSPAGWAIKITDNGTYTGATVELSTDGSWDTDHLVSYTYMRYPAGRGARLCVTGNTDGTDLKLWWRASTTPETDPPLDTTCSGLLFICQLDTFDTGMPDPTYAMVGPNFSNSAYDDHVSRCPSQYGLFAQLFHRDPLKGGRTKHSHAVDWAVDSSRYSFSFGAAAASAADLVAAWRENSPRIGHKTNIMEGTVFIADENNENGDYALAGLLKGHWTGHAGLPIMQVLSSDGTKGDLIHIGDAFIVEWPDGISSMETFGPAVRRSG